MRCSESTVSQSNPTVMGMQHQKSTRVATIIDKAPQCAVLVHAERSSAVCIINY